MERRKDAKKKPLKPLRSLRLCGELSRINLSVTKIVQSGMKP